MELNTPQLRNGQILVKLLKAGLCRSQLMEARGLRGQDKYLPHLLGHEGVAEVIQIGAGVSKVSVGQRVILGWIKGSGLDSGGTTIESLDGRTINAGAVTTFSEYSIVSENRVTPCPDDISNEMAVLLGCALPTGAGIVINQVKPDTTHSVLLVGLGGIGLSALLMLKYLNPKKVVVIDKNPEKISLAKKLGFIHAYILDENILQTVRKCTPSGFDFSIECAGTTASIELAFELLHNQGTCIFASHPPEGEKIQIDPHALICGKQLIGSWGGASNPDTDLVKIGRIIQSMDLPEDLFISHRYTLETINSAFNDLEQGKVVRAMIEF